MAGESSFDIVSQFDRQELATHPLQVGLSMDVKVDTHDQSGERLPRLAQGRTADASHLYDPVERAADDRVQSIIAVNDGRTVPLAPPAVSIGHSAVPTAHLVASRTR